MGLHDVHDLFNIIQNSWFCQLWFKIHNVKPARIKPWITPAIRKPIAIKNKMFHAYLKNRNQFHYSQFKMYRNKLKHLIAISKKQYFFKYFSDNLNNVKITWKGIKQLILTKSKKTQWPNNIVINNKSITDSKEIANIFNEYFASIGPELAHSIPHVNKSYTEYLTRPSVLVFSLIRQHQRKSKKKIQG